MKLENFHRAEQYKKMIDKIDDQLDELVQTNKIIFLENKGVNDYTKLTLSPDDELTKSVVTKVEEHFKLAREANVKMLEELE